jgi:hypothetical protein
VSAFRLTLGMARRSRPRQIPRPPTAAISRSRWGISSIC